MRRATKKKLLLLCDEQQKKGGNLRQDGFHPCEEHTANNPILILFELVPIVLHLKSCGQHQQRAMCSSDSYKLLDSQERIGALF